MAAQGWEAILDELQAAHYAVVDAEGAVERALRRTDMDALDAAQDARADAAARYSAAMVAARVTGIQAQEVTR